MVRAAHIRPMQRAVPRRNSFTVMVAAACVGDVLVDVVVVVVAVAVATTVGGWRMYCGCVARRLIAKNDPSRCHLKHDMMPLLLLLLPAMPSMHARGYVCVFRSRRERARERNS